MNPAEEKAEIPQKAAKKTKTPEKTAKTNQKNAPAKKAVTPMQATSNIHPGPTELNMVRFF